MSRRPIIVPESAFEIVQTDGTNNTVKVVERFDMRSARVQFTLTSGVYTLQGSVDGNTYEDIQASINANTTVELSHFWRYMRVVTVTAGDGTATLGAYELVW